MVFEHIMLVVGFVASIEDVKKLLNLTDEDLEEENITQQKLKKQIRGSSSIALYPYLCCSDISQKKFIIGKVVKSWNRKITICPECPKLQVCDDCICETEHGSYPIEKIFNNTVECPIENVCMYCWRDNKVRIRNGCEACGHRPNWDMKFDHKEDNKFEDKEIVKTIDKYKVEKGLTGEVKIYYFLDDCIYC